MNGVYQSINTKDSKKNSLIDKYLAKPKSLKKGKDPRDDSNNSLTSLNKLSSSRMEGESRGRNLMSPSSSYLTRGPYNKSVKGKMSEKSQSNSRYGMSQYDKIDGKL